MSSHSNPVTLRCLETLVPEFLLLSVAAKAADDRRSCARRPLPLIKPDEGQNTEVACCGFMDMGCSG
ncbi:hypothetical protein OPV22_003089 [Ensete ventricosum]|uniref:Uncharacterized protein n=1 Tax=Ensete ventricosum TaxID=4639 RepID=A0AAV8RZL7_ENSVE|nr:hypothetical protein OPV22_003089 [Ensete ventricosum]